MNFAPNTPLRVLKQWLRSQLDDGAECPVCGQMAKVYHRKINSGAVRGLITMYRLAGPDWIHVPSTTDLSRLGGELARLRYWGLLEEETAKRPDGGRAGWWKITPRGIDFIHRRLRVPKYIRIYDGRVLGYDTAQMVDIKDALGAKFNYGELMAGI